MIQLTPKKDHPLAAMGFLLISSLAANAGSGIDPDATRSSGMFEKGHREVQLGVGLNFSTTAGSLARPSIQDVAFYLRHGWMLTSVKGDGLSRGNWEFLAEIMAANVTTGPGSVIAGGSMLLRYNFVRPASRWTPYFQIGGGGVYNDIYKNPAQGLVGQVFEFNLQGAIGLRYWLNTRTACYLEGNYRHLSNAQIADRNFGLNSFGMQVGVSLFW